MSTTLQNLYHTDYSKWLDETVALLKTQRLNELDLANLIEELESVGKSDRRSLESNLRILLAHLLKWQYQPEKRTGSWLGSIKEHRRRCNKILVDGPGLKTHLVQAWDECYQDARDLAATETELPLEHFPAVCPYSLTAVLDTGFLP